jgi:hypothetical protein
MNCSKNVGRSLAVLKKTTLVLSGDGNDEPQARKYATVGEDEKELFGVPRRLLVRDNYSCN